MPIPKAGAKAINKNADLKQKLIEEKLKDAMATDDAVDAVDAKMYNHRNYKVYTNNGRSFSAYLMCADLKNNANKFYVCQVV